MAKPAFSTATARSTAAGTCPHCGGSQFKAKRSRVGKMVAGPLARKSQVRCTTCGTTYARG